MYLRTVVGQIIIITTVRILAEVDGVCHTRHIHADSAQPYPHTGPETLTPQPSRASQDVHFINKTAANPINTCASSYDFNSDCLTEP